MKTTTFSNKHFIILGQLLTIVLLSNAFMAKRNKINSSKQVETPIFQDDQCFCGIRFNQTKKLNLDLFGPGIAGKILNYVDQSISKFNGLNLTSEFVYNEKNNNYNFQNKLHKKSTFKGNAINYNQGKSKLTITKMKSILFSNDQWENKVMTLNFMMGRAVSFQIMIKFTDKYKKQFDFSFKQLAYVAGDPEKTREMTRKNEFSGYFTNRSLSHFDKNQLQVDICRAMYTVLNQITIREFNTSINSNIVQYGKTRRSFDKGVSCKKEVVFRERYTNDYFTEITQKFFNKLDKNKYKNFRASLNLGDMTNFKVVNQNNSQNDDLTKTANQNNIDLFNDKSEESDLNEEETSSNNLNLKRQQNITLDYDESEFVSENSSVKTDNNTELKMKILIFIV